MKKNDKILLNSVGVYILSKEAHENNETIEFTLLVNIYEQDPETKLPGKQLLEKQIIVNSTLQISWLDVDLSNRSLILDKPFFVAFQWTSPENKLPWIGNAGSDSNTFERSSPLGIWEPSEIPWVIKAEGTKIEFEK